MNIERQVEGLLTQVCDGVATDETYEVLQGLLAESKEARRIYLQYLDMDAEFQAAAIDLRESMANSPKKMAWRWWSVAIVAAAAVVLVFLLPFESENGVGAPVSMQLVSEHAAVWGSGRLPSRSESIERELRLLSGLAELRLSNGVQIIVQGPAELMPTGRNLLLLKSGRLTCSVPRQGVGFTVRTPTTEIVDVGTVFGVQVSADASEEVHTFSGLVRVLPNLSSAALDVPEGTAITVGANGVVTETELKPDAFSRTTKPILEYERVLRNAYDVCQRDQIRVYYTFDDLGASEKRRATRVTNLATRSPEYDGRVLGAEAHAGRFVGSRALRFSSESDAVRFRFDAELRALTLAAWVKIEELPPTEGFTSLLMTDRWNQVGQIHWQLHTRDGQPKIEFSILPKDWAKDQVDWHSEPIDRDALIGKWCHLVTTYNGEAGEINFFLNGKLVGHRKHAPPVARIGQGHLGAWAKKTNQLSRPLPGSMDEFILIARALSSTEIESLYTLGRPVE